jgi:DNA gyrase subunit B
MTEETAEKMEAKPDGSESYTAKDIQVLSGLEGVRKRPAMYIGDTGKRGLHHLIFEIVDNSIDEALAGYCKNIEVILHKNGFISVRDDGRGIPTEIHPQTGKSALETISLTLHAGGKFDKKAYQVSGGLHGVGTSVVNALSERMEIEVHRSGKRFNQSCERGKLVSAAKETGATTYRGTIVKFKPDAQIFQTTELDYDYLKDRFLELAFLNPKITFKFIDERTEPNKEETYHYEGGLAAFAEHLNRARNKLHVPYFFHKKTDNVDVEFAIQYTDAFNELIYSFVNDIRTVEGGTHVVGFRMALTRALNEYMHSSKIVKDTEKRITGDDAAEGITAVVAVKVMEPQFEGQTKTKLGNSEVKGIVDSVVYEALLTYLNETPDVAKRISQKVLNSLEAREAAQKAKDLIRRKNVFETSVLPGKLADCESEDPTLSELYIVEGDSAGGSMKMARDRKHQAVLPLRGKILNVEKAQLAKILASAEIRAIILSLGCGFGEDFNLQKMRYHKIVIATDADVDGSHIRTLLLTLFYRYFKPVVEAGYIYIATPPLYKVWKGKVVKYAYSDNEKDKLVAEMGDPSIQRYKGLGEMNPDQLWDTTINPENRTLKKVSIEDAMKADELFDILMGEEVEPRRRFIEENAKAVQNLDI